MNNENISIWKRKACRKLDCVIEQNGFGALLETFNQLIKETDCVDQSKVDKNYHNYVLTAIMYSTLVDMYRGDTTNALFEFADKITGIAVNTDNANIEYVFGWNSTTCPRYYKKLLRNIKKYQKLGFFITECSFNKNSKLCEVVREELDFAQAYC